MVLLCLVSALLSYNVKRIIKNWKDTKAKAVGNTIELKIKKNSTKSIETGALVVFFYVCLVLCYLLMLKEKLKTDLLPKLRE